ncbi:MORN motif [Trypanosoma melophagium]|uniref:MORN motif n=1 Tax=Trypanosoma melophagium TaxID=715481 RepID=UPI00351A049A|nr:MORN motif [Trypanosoma melophagium]
MSAGPLAPSPPEGPPLQQEKNKNPQRYTYKSGAVYEGTFDGTKRHGRGHWRHPGGETYEGEYVNNKQEGLGVYLFTESGKCYLGQWKAGEMHGEGVYYFTHDHNTFYVGGYAHDKKNGSGFYCYENGIVTSQMWDNGLLQSETEATPLQRVECAMKVESITAAVRAVAPNVLGVQPPPSEVRTFQFPSGATYTGQYYGTKKHGVGYWAHPEGDSYDGQFESNKHSGWGVYIIGRSGKKYVGHWSDGKMNGVGVYFFNPQETEYFIGSYRDDVKHGRGLYHFAESGSNRLQLWENGSIKDEVDGDETVVQQYHAAMKKIIEIVRSFAPRYEPISAK